MLKKHYFLLFLATFILLGCYKNDPIKEERGYIEPNLKKRIEDARDKGGGIFGDIGRSSNKQNTVEFSNANVLWRATLKSLDFLPLANVDYSGGVIVYDWYSESTNSNEQIKISVQFLNNELRSDSLKVTAHKKICNTNENCSSAKLDQDFANKVKDNIISSARLLKIEESKTNKK
jgi:hypothetical protein